MTVAVIGAGGWGTALSVVAARAGACVKLWSRSADAVEEINRSHTNGAYLAGHEIPPAVSATVDAGEALRGSEVVILAAPSHATRAVLGGLKEFARPEMIFVSATKGVEVETGARVSEIVSDVLGEAAAARFVCLSGPSFAREVAAGEPTAVVAASDDDRSARRVQAALSAANFRVYTNGDVTGTELGGASKNVIALAAGMLSGLGLGSNSQAALVTRGLAEMTRLALAEGARLETLMGLAGLGDLVLTCTGALSRNRRVGHELGRGRTLGEVLEGMREVAEGVRTARALMLLARRRGVELPITEEVNAVLYENKSARAAVESLMSRPLRDESEGVKS
ncbi:MAG TPA: NAD(P)H-dependent glycerol-3-phosphate dehydrogenase [Pyrinomonadaceae bacterium]|jgi:glycerol-3-phosphate dehydrogenase (NAD(P)+)|nr:NAD(P)H-dependent glycerol-3-phosphate dehydrogenase [Pyrinomonadaceae bacterium]